jgi:hypothetical protein
MKPEVPFAVREASFQQPCIAEVCMKYMLAHHSHKNLQIKVKSPIKHKINSLSNQMSVFAIWLL